MFSSECNLVLETMAVGLRVKFCHLIRDVIYEVVLTLNLYVVFFSLRRLEIYIVCEIVYRATPVLSGVQSVDIRLLGVQRPQCHLYVIPMGLRIIFYVDDYHVKIFCILCIALFPSLLVHES